MWQHKVLWSLVAVFCMTVTNGADITCITCDSSTDANCITDLTKFTGTTCTTECFTQIDDAGKVTRGCKATAAAECTAPNCLACKTNDCNKHNICKKCDSTTDADCSQTDASKAAFNELCAAVDTKCLTNVKTDKQLERRCATATDVCASGDTCALCTGANCNSGYFPSKRIQCYHCDATADGSKCSNVEANDIAKKPCRLYDAADKCYTYGTSDTAMTRGCVSDADTAVNKCSKPETEALCLSCATDNCNNRQYKRSQTLKCINCSSTATDNACEWGQQESSATTCGNQLLYNAEDACYTQSKDKLVHRGCFYDRGADLGDCTEANACSKCSTGDGCNSRDTANFSCIRCRSDEETKCRNEADTLTGTACRNSVTEATSKCFGGKWNDVVIRGCLIDADERTQNSCNDPKDNQCKTCDKKDCNTEKSAAGTLAVTSGLLAAMLCIMARLQ